MKICEISAKNFRTLEDFTLSLHPAYSAISGKNNAGKSAIVAIIQYFFENSEVDYFSRHLRSLSFRRDFTQWGSDEEMLISASVQLDKQNDSEVFFVVETFSEHKITEDTVVVKLTQYINSENNSRLVCEVGGSTIEGQKASEILKKFRSASNLVVHNSTNQNRGYYLYPNEHVDIMEQHFSLDDRQRIADAQKTLQTRVQRAAKQHKDELDKLLGKLSDKYQVELSSIEIGPSARYPVQIKLTDKSVDAPLSNWGSGTQNRTRILMSVLEAVRMRTSSTNEDRSTPVFIVEEPESFLHPSAQAEFGQILNSLAEELNIQIIATTHSPYMLNQREPSANYLLERKFKRGLPRETFLRDTSGNDWMVPFAENLGIIPSEFKNWKNVFSTQSDRVILVEGDIDKEYFEHFKENYKNIYTLPDHIEIVPYGGKDSLKNSSILQFMIKRFGKVFITFDLDAKKEIEIYLNRVNLSNEKDYLSIGSNSPGDECIEGLIPTKIKQKVYSEKYNLVTALTSGDGKARSKAKIDLKRALLNELCTTKIEEAELNAFKDLFKKIGKAFNSA